MKQKLEPARGIGAFRSLCSLQVGHSPFQCSCSSHLSLAAPFSFAQDCARDDFIPDAQVNHGTILRRRMPLAMLNAPARHILVCSGQNPLREFWSRREESNPRQADYKSAALPAELRRPGNSYIRCSVSSSEALLSLTFLKAKEEATLAKFSKTIWHLAPFLLSFLFLILQESIGAKCLYLYTFLNASGKNLKISRALSDISPVCLTAISPESPCI